MSAVTSPTVVVPAPAAVPLTPLTPERPPISRLSEEFPDDDYDTCCKPLFPSSRARTWEDQEEAFSNGDYGTCCKLAVISRVKHAAAAVMEIPWNLLCTVSYAGCGAALLGCSVLQGVLGGIRCILCCSDKQCAIAGKCCVFGTECLTGSGCYGLFLLWNLVRCPGNIPCSELQSLGGQHRVDLWLRNSARSYSKGVKNFNEIFDV